MKQELFDTVKSITDSLELDIYHFEFKKNVLKILIEANARPVTIETCANAARLVSTKLDSVDSIPYRYRLEVSSPGIERILYKPEHYKRFIGHNCHLITKQGFILGKIIEADDEIVKLEKIDGVSSQLGSNQVANSSFITVLYAEIKSGQLKVSDDSLFRRRHETNDQIGKDTKERQ
jgi:ribosome maturation factor RimP